MRRCASPKNANTLAWRSSSLARHYDDLLVQIADIAERNDIPKKFLEQILILLKKRRVYPQLPGRPGRVQTEQAPVADHIGRDHAPRRRSHRAGGFRQRVFLREHPFRAEPGAPRHIQGYPQLRRHPPGGHDLRHNWSRGPLFIDISLLTKYSIYINY